MYLILEVQEGGGVNEEEVFIMPTSGDLKSGNSISCTTPTPLLNVKKPPPQPPQPYPTNQPRPQIKTV